MLMPEIMLAALDVAEAPKPTMKEWLESYWAKDPYDSNVKKVR